MAIYEVFGVMDIGSRVLTLGRVFGAENAVHAIEKIIDYYATDKYKGEVTITELRVWGGRGRVGTPEYDPNTLCGCHSSPLWKCSDILPPTVSITSDGISFKVEGD